MYDSIFTKLQDNFQIQNVAIKSEDQKIQNQERKKTGYILKIKQFMMEGDQKSSIKLIVNIVKTFSLNIIFSAKLFVSLKKSFKT